MTKRWATRRNFAGRAAPVLSRGGSSGSMNVFCGVCAAARITKQRQNNFRKMISFAIARITLNDIIHMSREIETTEEAADGETVETVEPEDATG